MSAQAVLFDAPGPKARMRHRLLAVVGAAAILAVLALVVRGLANPDNNQLTAEKWQPFLTAEAWTAYFLPGIWATVKAAGLAVLISTVFGVLLGMGRLSDIAPVRVACGIFVEFFRAVPVLMMMLFSYFFGLYALGITGGALSLFGVVAGLVFYNSSVIAELIRSGVNSLPRGQREAGYAIGMTPTQTLAAILLPQAITAMLPSLVSQLVVILKDTALGYIISYPELIRAGQNFSSNKGNLIPVFMVLALLFVLINYALTRVARMLEHRLQVSGRGGRTQVADTTLTEVAVAGEVDQPGARR
jgi:glutamate transport system permease protein